MDYYMSNNDTGRGHSLLSDTTDVIPSRNNNKSRFDAQFDSRNSDDSSALDMPDSYSASASSSHSSASFLPLSPSLRQRLFPPTTLARVLWLAAFLLLLFLVLLCGYEIGKRLVPASQPAPLPTTGRSRVILVSIDGFRASYLSDYPTLLPTLKAMQYAGSYAKRMQSCMPSSTFPNHWSIVTGLYTEEHGITSNNIYDATQDPPTFNMQTLNPAWWGGEPIWNTAIKQNLRANVMYCQISGPGSEVLVQNMRPTRWFPFNDSTPNMDRVNTVLGWLDQRSCDLCVTYFSTLDSAGHSGGPNSTQVRNALPIIDSLIAALLRGIQERGLIDDVTLILTSDHGMSAINVNRSVSLAQYTDLTVLRITDLGATLGIWPNDLSSDNVDRIYRELYGKVPQMSVYKRAQVPEDLHYNNNPRNPPIVGLMNDGWVVSGANPYTRGTGGTHGYDPRLPSMGALWLGVGKGLKRGGMVENVENVNVYSLLCWLLGLVPAKNSGSLEVWRDVMATTAKEQMSSAAEVLSVLAAGESGVISAV